MGPDVPAEETAWEDLPKFSALDYAVFGSMLAASTLVGVVTALRSNTSASPLNYLQAKGSLPPLAILLSLLGGALSAISVLGNATEIYFFGTDIAVSLVGICLGSMIIYFVLLPAFFTHKLVSINEYLELRYASPVLRKLASLSQILNLFLLLGVLLYAPSIALSTVTNLPAWALILIIATVCTIYTTLGGVRAIVWTDVLQLLLMLAGPLLIVVLCVQEVGGMGQVWAIAQNGSRISFNTDSSPFVRHTVLSTIVYGLYLSMYLLGLNPPAFQRFSSLSSLQTAQRVCALSSVGCVLLFSIFYLSGLVAYAIYHDCDPLASGKIRKPDMIIPYLVMDRLRYLTGIPGIFVAAVYGAALSSASSYFNSTACLIWEDFLKGLPFFSRLSTTSSVVVLKILSFLAGMVALAMAQLMDGLGHIQQLGNVMATTTSSPVIGVYLAGILTPWVNNKGAIAGLVFSLCFNLWIMIGGMLKGKSSPAMLPLSTSGCSIIQNVTLFTSTSPVTATQAPILDQSESKTIFDISYCYYGVLGTIVCFLVCNLVSLVTGVVDPWTLKTGLVSPPCDQFYKFLWRLRDRRQEPQTQTTVNEKFEKLADTAV